MIHPYTELKFISEEKGYGVVAKEFIPKGTITWVQDKLDLIFTPAKIKELGPEYFNIIDTYTFRDNQGNHVLCWDHGRYVNHSFNSNCITTPYNFEIAIKDIQKGDELTDDYGYLNVTEPFNCIPEGGTRKAVYPDDLLNFHHLWDEQLGDAIQYFNSVKQPLISFLNNGTINKIKLILEGKEAMDSILSCYYKPVESLEEKSAPDMAIRQSRKRG